MYIHGYVVIFLKEISYLHHLVKHTIYKTIPIKRFKQEDFLDAVVEVVNITYTSYRMLFYPCNDKHYFCFTRITEKKRIKWNGDFLFAYYSEAFHFKNYTCWTIEYQYAYQWKESFLNLSLLFKWYLFFNLTSEKYYVGSFDLSKETFLGMNTIIFVCSYTTCQSLKRD